MMNLRVAFVLLVFLIMLATSLLIGSLVFLTMKLGWSPPRDRNILRFVFFILSISILLGSAITAIAGKRILAPIQNLTKATQEVARGNFDVQVPQGLYTSDNELGQLMRNFNLMVRELKGIEALRDNFINDFSHELKTPIVSIMGFAKLLSKDNLAEAKRSEYIEIIINESERLTRLSNNILTLARLENQGIVTQQTSFALDEQIRQVILLLAKAWGSKNINLHTQLDPITYYGNEEMLHQVWLNLLSNAIKFTPPAGEITVRCFYEGSDVKVRFQDQGIGMSDETQRHIFAKFYQGDTARASKGNGLGLPLVKRIVDLCGGSLSVKSQLGKGSTFTVKLPGASS